MGEGGSDGVDGTVEAVHVWKRENGCDRGDQSGRVLWQEGIEGSTPLPTAISSQFPQRQ